MPTPTTNYETLSLKQLSKIQSDVANAMARKVAEAEKAAPTLESQAVEYINDLVRRRGLPPVKTAVTVAVAQNGNGAHKKAKSRKRAKIAIKFRDPANPQNTWSGRGRPAKWLAALEKAGHKRAEYAVR